MVSPRIISVLAAAIAATPVFGSAIPALEKRQRAPGASITYYKDEHFQGDKQFFDRDRKDMQCYNLPSDWQNQISSYTNHNEQDWCCKWWRDLDCPFDKPFLRTQTADKLGGTEWDDSIKSYRCQANAEDFCDPDDFSGELAVAPANTELDTRSNSNGGYGSVTFCKGPKFEGECASFDNKNLGDKALPLGHCGENDDETTCCSWFSELDCGGNRFQATLATNITTTAFHDHIQSITCWDITDSERCIPDNEPAK
ncbi:hypothetical protein B0T21DRAFT_393172 [Apiosordaria backusii]|uniref:Uncharacterized protein n=1 Tax=Apiosordaria backusii TaxID=314023 RepID=A0AA40BLK6_9PEZI|nr:hypothetical protein B0T21DRAFT_393172 [Apiosordaria backusii]